MVLEKGWNALEWRGWPWQQAVTFSVGREGSRDRQGGTQGAKWSGNDEVGLLCGDTGKVLLWEGPPGGWTQAGLKRGETDEAVTVVRGETSGHKKNAQCSLGGVEKTPKGFQS